VTAKPYPVRSRWRPHVIAADGRPQRGAPSLGVEFDGLPIPSCPDRLDRLPLRDTLTDIAYVNYIADPLNGGAAAGAGLWRVLVPAPELDRTSCCLTNLQSVLAARGAAARAYRIAHRSIYTCISAWRELHHGRSCSPATPRTSTIRSAGWA